MKPTACLSLLFSLVFFHAIAGRASGTESGPLSIPSLSARADIVVIGKVAAVRSDWNSNRTMIFTTIDLEVGEILKGAVSGQKISFYLSGGQVGDIASEVAGTPRFALGERVLLFLSSRRGGRHGVVGLYQGKFGIEPDPSSGQDMAVRRVPGVAEVLDRIPLELARTQVRTTITK